MLRALALLLALAVPAGAQVAVSVPAVSGRGTDLAVAPDGTLYLAGVSGPADFDPGPGDASADATGGFVAAYASDGSFQWVWSATDGSGTADVEAVATRPGGGVVAVGQLRGTLDVDPGPGVETVSASDGLLVIALSAAGALDWAVAVEGAAQVWAQGVGVDDAGDVYLTGWIQTGSGQAVDLDPGPGVAELTTTSLDLFVASFDASGAFRWAFDVGAPEGTTPAQVRGYDLAVGAGGVFVTGSFRGPRDFDPGAGVAEVVASGTDGFVARYTTAGALDWVARFGPSFRRDVGYGVAADGTGGALVAGSVEDGSTQEDLYVARFDASGAPVWSHQLGTAGGTITDRDEFLGAAVVGDRAVVAGRFDSTFDADPGPDEALIAVPSGAPFNGVYGVVAAYDLATGAFDAAVRIGDVSQTGLAAVAPGPSDGAPPVVAGTFTGSVSLPGGAELAAPASFATNPFAAGIVLGTPPPLALTVDESIGVVDEPSLVAALRLLIAERIGVADDISLFEALQLLVEERIGVVDEADLIRALRVLVEERIGARDGLALDLPGASFGSVFVSVDGRIVYADDVALGLGLVGVTGMGDVAVLRVIEGDPPSVLGNTWIVSVEETLSFGDGSEVRIPLDAAGGAGDPSALAIEYTVAAARGGMLLATTYEAETGTLVGVGLPGAGALRVVPATAEAEAPPTAFALHAPFPNPSAGSATVRFDLAEAARATLVVYDVLGRRVATLVDADLPAGSHDATVPASLRAGTYLVRLTAGAEVAVRSVVRAR